MSRVLVRMREARTLKTVWKKIKINEAEKKILWIVGQKNFTGIFATFAKNVIVVGYTFDIGLAGCKRLVKYYIPIARDEKASQC